MVLILNWTSVFGVERRGTIKWNRESTLDYYKFEEASVPKWLEGVMRHNLMEQKGGAPIEVLLGLDKGNEPNEEFLLGPNDEHVVGTAVYRLDNPHPNSPGIEDMKRRLPAFVIDKGAGRGYVAIITGQYYDMLMEEHDADLS